MATSTQNLKALTESLIIVNQNDGFIDWLIPRRCMVAPTGMILSGLGIPVMMVFQILPVTAFLGFVCLALIAVGGVLTLVNCGNL